MDNNYEKSALIELYHHGIIGQKWGIRRFQNEDGTLTPAGKDRYNVDKLKTDGGRKNILDTIKNKHGRYVEKQKELIVKKEKDKYSAKIDEYKQTAKDYYDSAEKIRKEGLSSLDDEFGDSIDIETKKRAVGIVSTECELKGRWYESCAEGALHSSKMLDDLDTRSMSSKELYKNISSIEKDGEKFAQKKLIEWGDLQLDSDNKDIYSEVVNREMINLATIKKESALRR